MGTGTRRSVSLATILLLAACEQQQRVESSPPPIAGQRPAVGAIPDPPAPPPPQDDARAMPYPVWREPPRRKPGEPVRDPAVRPRLLRSVPPQYPDDPRAKSITGVVLLELVIEPDGRVSGGRVLEPLPFGLTQKAIDAVRQWRYTPAEDPPGTPVRTIENVTVVFRR